MADLLKPLQPMRRATDQAAWRAGSLEWVSIDPGRCERRTGGKLEAARRAFTTRHVPSSSLRGLMPIAGLRPLRGDLMLAIVTRTGHPARLLLADGACVHLHLGDAIVVAFDAPDRPDDAHGMVVETPCTCSLFAGVGFVGLEPDGGVSADATTLSPVGLVTDRMGLVVNLLHYAVQGFYSTGFESRIDSASAMTG